MLINPAISLLNHICVFIQVYINISMRLKEIETNSKLVIVVKGLHSDGFSGNKQCIALADQLNASIFEYTEAGAITALIAERKPKTLVLIGYSAGVKTIMTVGEGTNPTLSIFIAGYPTTLLNGEAGVKGPYVNYYQQKELDDLLAKYHGGGTYKPQGGVPRQVNVAHGDIVAAVTPAIVAQVNRLTGNRDLEVKSKPVMTPTEIDTTKSRTDVTRYKR
jgi:hypothetical protein